MCCMVGMCVFVLCFIFELSEPVNQMKSLMYFMLAKDTEFSILPSVNTMKSGLCLIQCKVRTRRPTSDFGGIKTLEEKILSGKK